MYNAKMKYRFLQQSTGPTKIYIYDDITAQGDFNWDTWEYNQSETSANHFVDLLSEIPDGGELELHINSYGGEVKEGVAIYSLLKQKDCKKTCYIDCFAYSVAYVIAMACDKIVMGPGTSIMIHDMWTVAAGNARELRKQADDLDVLMESNRKIFLERCNLTEDKLIEMMQAETILGPDKCLEYGFCDDVRGGAADLTQINQLNEKRFSQLKQEYGRQQTLLQYSKEFYQLSHQQKQPEEPEKPVPETGTEEQPIQKESKENKALNMLGAFFNAF